MKNFLDVKTQKLIYHPYISEAGEGPLLILMRKQVVGFKFQS